ncbi:hypothetical protein B0H11DRAFT_2058414 [Mycena galericulata]|nr:hypothetical protein B0H11DRAFT_2058414 [Mycena galericulata]
MPLNAIQQRSPMAPSGSHRSLVFRLASQFRRKPSETTHVFSDKSVALGRDTFFFAKFPLDIERRVLAPDARKCRVTGAIDEVMVMWIVPPPWAWAVAHPSDPPGIAPTPCSTDIHPLEVDPAPFLVAANAITIHQDLKLHFYNHAFAVDADDDFRVIVFRDMGDVQRLLPTHLPRRADSDDHDAAFFRLHLRYSLSFMLLGGDVTEKYPPHRILNAMQDLGVSLCRRCRRRRPGRLRNGHLHRQAVVY